MAWRSAPSVAAALAEATRRWPQRSRASDGTVGDAAHQLTKSDHNPDEHGVVHAFDLTHDPAHGVDCEVLAEHLVTGRDRRIAYVIWNRRICKSGAWTWAAYTRPNPHNKHLHVSIKHAPEAENDVSPWWELGPVPSPPPGTAPAYPGTPISLGSFGAVVRLVQQRLKDRAWILTVDGVFGPKTRQIVVAFQRQRRLLPDGVVGPKTWAALWGT